MTAISRIASLVPPTLTLPVSVRADLVPLID